MQLSSARTAIMCRPPHSIGTPAVIRVLLAHHGRLVRGALVSALADECDIEVVAEAADGDEVLAALLAERPDVAVVDFDLPAAVPMSDLCAEMLSHCHVMLIAQGLADSRYAEVVTSNPDAGLISADSPITTLVEGLRRVSRGQLVRDPVLARAAVTAGTNPLTSREKEVLKLAVHGLTTRDIAARLVLSHGTVRNHLARVLAKSGARTRIEAIRIAQQSGWI